MPAKHIAYYDLQEALGQPGCPICRLVARDLRRYLETLLDTVNDVGMRHELRATGGFCREHTWQAVVLGRHLSVAILWHDLLSTVLEAGEQGLSGGRRACRGCVACRKAAAASTLYAEVLGRHLEHGELVEEYGQSAGLCLPHLRVALAGAGMAARKRLVSNEAGKLERLQAELQEIIRKHDYRHAAEPWGAEKDAWARAAAKLAGEQPERGMP